MYTGAMPLADLRSFRDKRLRTRRNRESMGGGGNRTDGLRHVGAWDVWRESGRRASEPKGPPSHAGTAPFFVPASRGDAEAIASTAGAIVIAARSLGRFDEIHRASRGCEGARATKDVE